MPDTAQSPPSGTSTITDSRAAFGQLGKALDVRVRTWRLGTTQRYGRSAGVATEFRGALGKAMHGRPEFSTLFRPQLVGGDEPVGLRGGSGAPLPFVPRTPTPDRLDRTGGAIEAEIVLLGRAAASTSPWDRAVELAARDGFGRPRARFEVQQVTDTFVGTLTSWVNCRRRQLGSGGATAFLRVTLDSPVWLKSRGERLLPTPGAVLVASIRRACMLADLYGSAPAPAILTGPLCDLAAGLEESALYEEEFEERRSHRFSAAQSRRIPLTGIGGWFQGPIDPALQDVYLAAELLHVGRLTSVGLGRIRVGAPLLGRC